MAEMMDFLRFDLGGLRADVDEKYVASEDFEDLLEEALQRAARERLQAKRQAYARFIAQDVTQRSAELYDAKLRVLRKLEGLQEEHLKVLSAVVNEEPPDSHGGRHQTLSSNQVQTLVRRTSLPEQRVKDICEDLQQEDLLEKISGGMMTSDGAERTKHLLSRVGRDLVGYLTLETRVSPRKGPASPA